MEEITVDLKDMYDTAIQQRDAAMNEIVRMSAIIRTLTRKLEPKQPEVKDVDQT
jgi:hypothetical protein